jgi:hypothetical protein
VFTPKCHALQGRSTKRLTVATGFYFSKTKQAKSGILLNPDEGLCIE